MLAALREWVIEFTFALCEEDLNKIAHSFFATID